jgi:prefoldin alpha subunit
MKQEEMQQKAVLYQIMQKHMEELQQQMLLMENRLMELQATKQVLEDMKDRKGSEILLPLGSGCYIHGKVPDASKILVNLGSDVVAEKGPQDALELIEAKNKDVLKMIEKLKSDATELVSNMNTIAMELSQAQK